MAFERNETLQKVIEIITEKLKISVDSITESSTLQDLGADSLDLVELVMKFEETFGIEINDDDAEQFENVGNVVDYVQTRRKK
jgi:acyl carrier protein